MRFILSSCGLSILTNYLKKFNIFPGEVYKYSNLKKEEIDKEFLEKVEGAIGELKKEMVNYSNEELKRLSAELNALISFYKGRFDERDVHFLFVTDTYLGELVAELLVNFFESKGINAQKFKAKDLKTSSVEEFEVALSDIVKELSVWLEEYQSKGYEVIFNLTGGYKSVNSFLQTMATLWADRSIYIFEGSNELLEIPKLPLKIDRAIFAKYFNVFRKLEKGLKVTEEEVKGIPSAVVIKIDNDYSLSSWGEIIWQKYKLEVMKSDIFVPLSGKITYSEEFKKDFEDLNPSEKSQLNRSIEKLENLAERGENLKSLNYHPLKGEIAKKYSHEFYPFDGNDNRRVYCNEKDWKIVLEKIGSHLK